MRLGLVPPRWHVRVHDRVLRLVDGEPGILRGRQGRGHTDERRYPQLEYATAFEAAEEAVRIFHSHSRGWL